MALDEFIAWYERKPRPGFTKATVSAWRVSLEARGLGSSSIIIRRSAIRKLSVEAADNYSNGLAGSRELVNKRPPGRLRRTSRPKANLGCVFLLVGVLVYHRN